MAKARSAKKRRRSSKTQSRRRSRSNGGSRDDAIGLLKSDHREVERLFGEFENARGAARKEQIAEQICEALKAHTTIEEEIFYPAFLAATDETEIHHEAEIEHEGAKRLIEEIESTGPADDHFEARVSVLKEMIKHHVNEEEQRGGMFSKAQGSDMDLAELGRQLRDRKLELVGETAEDMASSRRRPPPQGRARRGGRELRMRGS